MDVEGKQRSSADVWMNRCIDQWADGCGDISMMITLFNAATSAKWFHKFWHQETPGIACFPDKRIQFIHPETLKPSTQNQYASAILAWCADRPSQEAFANAFSDYGLILQDYV
jgi:hypothetical protein